MSTDKQPPKTWGVSSAEFYYELRNKPVIVATLDGKAYRGTFAGVDLYDVVLTQPSGGTILLAKHAIKFVQPDTADKPA